MGWLDRLRGQGTPRTVMLNGGGIVRAVGESYYQGAFVAICGPKCDSGYFMPVEATLVPEPENPHDENSVAVMVGARKVGHLSRADAKAYQPLLLRLRQQGVTATCRAVVKGGWSRSGSDSGHFGIVLALSSPRTCHPPTETAAWKGNKADRLEWLRGFSPVTGNWACDGCSATWTDPEPVPANWACQREGPHVCVDCGSFAFSYPV